MKRLSILSFGLLFMLGLSAPTAQAQAPQIGISIGSNFSQLSDIDLGTGTSSFENSQGWHAEVWFDLPAGNFTLRPALRYTQAGSIFQFANESNQLFQDEFDVSMFEIPIDVRFLFNMQLIRPFMTVGPILRFSSSSRADISGMRNASIAGGIGIGLELRFAFVVLYPEIKYTFGLTPFTNNEFSIDSIPFTTNDPTLLNGVMLRVGIGVGG